MAKQRVTLKQTAKKEAALLMGLLFLGFVVMPVAIFLVGEQFFGAYGGQGFGHFFGVISGKLRAGDTVAWFLILSPYLAWQISRLTVFGWRASSPNNS